MTTSSWPDARAARSLLELELTQREVGLSETQVMHLLAYLDLLHRWNQRMNLAALDDPLHAVRRLLVEPVVAASVIDDNAALLVDIGSGGGSPAIPLKIARPDLALTMVEVRTKKSVFLREVVRSLGLARCTVENASFESVLGRAPLIGGTDVVSVRAVRMSGAGMSCVAEALRPGGQMLWFLSASQAVSQVVRPLVEERQDALIPDLASRLVVLRRPM